MSRRLWTTEVQRLLRQMEQCLLRLTPEGWVWFVDGKPLAVGNCSKDPESRWGRAARGMAKGYKLHAVYGSSTTPSAWEIEPMNISEPDTSALLLPRLRRGGYVVGDKSFDSNRLHDLARSTGHQLVAQRKRPNSGLGHRRHSPGRLRCMELLQHDFGRALLEARDDIERRLARLTNHAAGLAPLPNWVRRIWRVRGWTLGKLLIHALYAAINAQTLIAGE